MAFVNDTRLLNTTAPLTGGANLQSDLTFAMPQASGAGAGYLSSADWTTFNNKQPALGYTAQDVANLVTAFVGPTNAQYPSALLVSNTFALYTTTSNLNANFVPKTTTVNGQPLSANVSLAASDVGLSNVTNVAQAFASIHPNTTPLAGQILVGDGSKYNPVTMSGAATINSAGVVSISFPNAAVGVLGVTQMSVAPVGPPIAFGQNDPAVQLTANLVITLAGADNTHYPSALLVSNQLAGKVQLGAAQTPGTYTKLTCDAQGLITATAQATTNDINDFTDKRYMTDAQRTNVANLSGINTGDQSLAGLALVSDLASANAAIAGLSAALTNYAQQSDLAATNNSVTTLASSVTTNNEVKLTFSSGLTRVANAVTNDAMTLSQTGPKFLGVHGTGVPSFIQPAASDLSNGLTGTTTVVLSASPTITTPTLIGPVPISVTDSLNTAITSILTLSHDITGATAGVGMGTALDFLGASNTTPDREMAQLAALWVVATDGSRTSKFQIRTVSAGTFPGVIPFTLTAQGGLSVGDGSYDPGTGVVHAEQGFQVGSVAAASGQFLRGNGLSYIGGLIAPGDVHKIGLVEHKGSSKTTTTDQTSSAETAHMTFTLPANDAAIGQTFRIVAWGTMDNGASAVTFTPRIRWGNTIGVQIVSLPIVGTTTAQTNSTWKIDAVFTITGAGVSGGAFGEMVTYDHTTSAAGAITVQETNSGSTAIVVDTTSSKDLTLSWTMSSTLGTPHVRTFSGFIEQLS